jgi:hypothetical protein
LDYTGRRSIYEWNSSNINITDYAQSQAVYPWETPMTLTIETGFKYFIIKCQFNITNYYITPETETNLMNIAYNGGQGFEMISGYTGTTNYIPSAPILQQTMTDKAAGVAKRGLRLSVGNNWNFKHRHTNSYRIIIKNEC